MTFNSSGFITRRFVTLNAAQICTMKKGKEYAAGERQIQTLALEVMKGILLLPPFTPFDDKVNQNADAMLKRKDETFGCRVRMVRCLQDASHRVEGESMGKAEIDGG